MQCWLISSRLCLLFLNPYYRIFISSSTPFNVNIKFYRFHHLVQAIEPEVAVEQELERDENVIEDDSV